jgi:hypothetical protein
VTARDLPAQRPRLLDREQRRMRNGRVGDAEAIEQSEQFAGRGRHAGPADDADSARIMV